MKALMVFAILATNVFGAERNQAKTKTFSRSLPADVLRDFPGLCFSSTKCSTIEPGSSWELYPFCGRSTCVASEDTPPRLLEVVEDCGPLPLPNSKCKLDIEKTNKTAPFPDCCPIFKCEEGSKLQYPDIAPTTEVERTTTIAPTPVRPSSNDLESALPKITG